MQLKIELVEKESEVSLDRVIDMVLNNTEEGRHPQFAYMKFHEQRIMEKIRRYSYEIRKPELAGISGQELEALIENQSADLYDAMSEASIACLKHGMKLGAGLAVEPLH